MDFTGKRSPPPGKPMRGDETWLAYPKGTSDGSVQMIADRLR